MNETIFGKEGEAFDLSVLIVTFGTDLQAVNDFRRAFERSDSQITVNSWANNMMSSLALTQSLIDVDREREYRLVVLTTFQLTGKNSATTVEVFDGAQGLGLEMCPAWMGLKLRLVYQNQSVGEWLRIAMEPIKDLKGDLSIFAVCHIHSGLYLYGHYSPPDRLWYADEYWVLVLRSSPLAV